MTTVGQAIQRAVTEQDARLAGRVCSYLRLSFGMNYDQVYAFVNQIERIDAAEWDGLLYEADEEASR